MQIPFDQFIYKPLETPCAINLNYKGPLIVPWRDISGGSQSEKHFHNLVGSHVLQERDANFCQALHPLKAEEG